MQADIGAHNVRVRIMYDITITVIEGGTGLFSRRERSTQTTTAQLVLTSRSKRNGAYACYYCISKSNKSAGGVSFLRRPLAQVEQNERSSYLKIGEAYIERKKE